MPAGNDVPLVTVVTPCLNRAAFLTDVVLSVARQSYERIEHVIVDGGSSDGTQDLLAELEKDYGFRWVSEPDNGMYDAINKGLALSRGEILAYLNTDDLYLPWTVEVAVRAFAENPGAGLLYGDMVIVEERSGGVALALYPAFDVGVLGRSAFLGQPTVFFRRSVYTQLGGFDQSLRFVADCDYWLRAGSSFSTHKVDEILAVQRDHPETLRSSRRTEVDEEIRSVRSRYQQMTGMKSRLLRVTDRLHLFLDRRVRLVRFLNAANRSRRDPGYTGPWHRFLREGETFAISRKHIVIGLIPLAGRPMLFRMAKANGLGRQTKSPGPARRA